MNLNKLNGWQRLWLVASCLLFLGFGLFYPYTLVYGVNLSEYQYREATLKDFASGNCSEYINRPFPQLKEPAYSERGGSCWHLYTHRKYDPSPPPFSMEQYDKSMATHRRGEFQDAFLLFGGVSIVASAVVYFFGFLIAWIIRGFKITA
ncbi:hypothetical protein [Methylocystis sp. ATCC 49242]|uniref:hypothetical protein n=1 Tax=Methylocystis sp. ATCC 49242 TaxID=622637 RepID=UPI0001F885CA|nr:hypothetical protein [Methylocystis sp. ATCC 49242]